MNKEERRVIKSLVIMAIENSQLEMVELAELLELTVEDLIKAFPHRLVEHAEKFGVEKETDGESDPS